MINTKIEIPLYGIEEQLSEEMNLNSEKYYHERSISKQEAFTFNKSIEELFVNIQSNYNSTIGVEEQEYKEFIDKACKEFYAKLTGFYEGKCKEKMKGL